LWGDHKNAGTVKEEGITFGICAVKNKTVRITALAPSISPANNLNSSKPIN